MLNYRRVIIVSFGLVKMLEVIHPPGLVIPQEVAAAACGEAVEQVSR